MFYLLLTFIGLVIFVWTQVLCPIIARSNQPVCWSMKLSSPWYEYVASGQKQYEGRRYFKNVPLMKSKDLIVFTHAVASPTLSVSIIKKIVRVHKFATFAEALSQLDMSKILPRVSSISQGIGIYEKFVSIPTQRRDGICMIELENVY
jgi:ASC-1-like (ASCH) protein